METILNPVAQPINQATLLHPKQANGLKQCVLLALLVHFLRHGKKRVIDLSEDFLRAGL